VRDVEKLPTVAEVIGRNVKRLREERGETQDQLAWQLRRTGLDFSRSGIAAVERGSGRTLDVAELTLLCLRLGTSLDEILAGEGHVRVSPSCTIALNKIRPLLEGDSRKLGWEDLDCPTTREAVSAWPAVVAAMKSTQRRYRKLWPGALPWQLIEAERAAGDAETGIAERLGVRATDVSVAAHGRWGHSLTDERDARLAANAKACTAPRSVPAVRGHITRALIAELEPVLKEV